MADTEKTLSQLAQEVLDVQDACNLSGVVHAFSRAMHRLWDLPNAGTEAINRHPICVMWASKIAALTHCADIEVIGEAYNACRDLAEGKGSA